VVGDTFLTVVNGFFVPTTPTDGLAADGDLIYKLQKKIT